MALNLIEAAREICWEQLHTGPWNEVDDAWREAFASTTLSLVKRRMAILDVQNNKTVVKEAKSSPRERKRKRDKSNDKDNALLMKQLHYIDQALMMSPPNSRPLLHKLAEEIHELMIKSVQFDTEPWADNDNDCKLHTSSSTERSCIRRVVDPSMIEFLSIMKKREPVLIVGAMKDWPATSKWRDLSYFRKTCGWRSIPVELGSSYLSTDWSQQIMVLNNFLDNYIRTPVKRQRLDKAPNNGKSIIDPGKKGYLAQHTLFDQIPALRKDILVPDLCALGDEDDDGEVKINAWFGPGGTVSPLHFDPEHNILAQVVGRKKVILYSPKDSEYLYPSPTAMLHNTSQIDVENPDDKKFPLFRRAQPLEVELRSSEMLYIPPGYWHHVRSLSGSFSVSFWFGGQSAPQLSSSDKNNCTDPKLDEESK
eukprot:CAMPEP_0167748716 /NCGR_PEP_ID=MMETSP0110_2-20121227/4992_1 /TAXON_ID=629695 /ORGANISM="Gymnochlora sp., Strain CCMP2014" /LENGTH=422 /DNA_ID=CAMNT_0007633761 /DNA_START=135 /DNA_END=1403 /DNA_ORIENTATION=-